MFEFDKKEIEIILENIDDIPSSRNCEVYPNFIFNDDKVYSKEISWKDNKNDNLDDFDWSKLFD